MNISEFLLLEKRIAQIRKSIEVVFSFDVIKTQHVEDRQDFATRGLNVETYGHISNKEISDFVNHFKKEISENIAYGNIEDETNFVIRSKDWQLAMACVGSQVKGNYWKLIVKTVFRETDEFKLKIGKNQLVLDK